MQADNEEVTLMTKEEQALAADQPASLNLERSASMESVGDGEKPSGDHVPDALGPAVGSPLALLQQKVVIDQPGALPKLLSLLRLLQEIPDDDKGLAGWSQLEKIVRNAVKVQAAKDVNTVVARLSNMGAGKSGGKEDPETAEKLKKLEKTERELADLKKEVEDLRKRPPAPAGGGLAPPPLAPPPVGAASRRRRSRRRRSPAARRRRRSHRRRSVAASRRRRSHRRPSPAAWRRRRSRRRPPRRPGAAADPGWPRRRRRSRAGRRRRRSRRGAAAAARPGGAAAADAGRAGGAAAADGDGSGVQEEGGAEAGRADAAAPLGQAPRHEDQGDDVGERGGRRGRLQEDRRRRARVDVRRVGRAPEEGGGGRRRRPRLGRGAEEAGEADDRDARRPEDGEQRRDRDLALQEVGVEIASAITDGSETAFTSDQLSSLLAILPSAEDVETVKGQ